MPCSSLDPKRFAALLAIACGVFAAGCGSSQDETSTAVPRDKTAAKTATGKAATAGQEPGRHHRKGHRDSKPDRTHHAQQPDKDVSAAEPEAQPVRKHRPPQRSEDAKAIAGCPAGLSASECKAAAQAVSQTQGGPAGGSATCPAGLSEAECQQAAKAVEAPSSSPSSDASTCPDGLSATECREAAEALGR
jgi:hypothetical protein